MGNINYCQTDHLTEVKTIKNISLGLQKWWPWLLNTGHFCSNWRKWFRDFKRWLLNRGSDLTVLAFLAEHSNLQGSMWGIWGVEASPPPPPQKNIVIITKVTISEKSSRRDEVSATFLQIVSQNALDCISAHTHFKKFPDPPRKLLAFRPLGTSPPKL